MRSPLRALRWRLPWMRDTEAFARANRIDRESPEERVLRRRRVLRCSARKGNEAVRDAHERHHDCLDLQSLGRLQQPGDAVHVVDVSMRDEEQVDGLAVARLCDVLVNPRIVEGEGKTTFDEGCLSVPGFYETVERFLTVEIEAQDVNGKKFRVKSDGLLGICMQHEMDHLEGTLFIDHLSFLKSSRIKKQIQKHGYPVKGDDEEEDDSEGAGDDEGSTPTKKKVRVKSEVKS